jgi:hypothetical protein
MAWDAAAKRKGKQARRKVEAATSIRISKYIV